MEGLLKRAFASRAKACVNGSARKTYIESLGQVKRGRAFGTRVRTLEHTEYTKRDPVNPLKEHRTASNEVKNANSDAKSTGELDRLVRTSNQLLRRALDSQKANETQLAIQRLDEFQSHHPKTVIPLELYETFMYTLLSLRRPQAAINIWNRLIRSGQKPTCKTYTVMMRGAQHVRDLNGMEEFWRKLRNAGIQPDPHAWTTRIFGLLRSGKKEGMWALGEMAQEWIAAAKAEYLKDLPESQRQKASTIQESELIAKYDGDVDGVVRPSIVIMNSAVSALAASADTLIPKVLAWGRSFSIEPDLTTYNVLLNVSMRHGLSEEAFKILQRMQNRDIEADSTTWTVILTSLFQSGFLDDLDHEQQKSRLLDFIYGVEGVETKSGSQSTGRKIDLKGYAIIIDRLLKLHNNDTAAQAVLMHMKSRGIRPSAHIYTILMTAYLDSTPPNFVAAEALWESLESGRRGHGEALDSVFYDRMVEGYALHHRALGTSAPMSRFLDRMDKEGKLPSWHALEAAARCFAERGEWDRFEQLVGKVRKRLDENDQLIGGLGSSSMRPGQRDFWLFVISTGALAGEGINTPEQVVRESRMNPLRRRGLEGALDEGSEA